MLIALDQYGNRISATKGGIGYCQICNNRVKAYCGKIYTHHWKHKIENNCDPWQEQESEWHRAWKDNFPKNWQEVIIENGLKKHIADIKTHNGLVLELQNSSISSSTIKEREDFYKNIVWLINAEKFEKNFKIWSLTDEKLQMIKYHNRHSYINNKSESTEIIALKNVLTDIEYRITNEENNLSHITFKLTRLENELNNTSETAINYLQLKFSEHFFKDFKSELLGILQGNILMNEILEKQLLKQKNRLKEINELPESKTVNFEHFKVITSDKVMATSFYKCRLIEKASKDTLFPRSLTFKSEEEFDQISKNNDYILLIDLVLPLS